MCNALTDIGYPSFYDTLESIKLKDPLADLLGALEDGYVEFCYLDVVKSAGHSCPTVAGAYMMALYGLKALYGKELPVRGEIQVSFSADPNEGAAGVVANVFTQITGATQHFGFKGLGGHFVRHGLMDFNEEIGAAVQLTNAKTDKSVKVRYKPELIQSDPRQKELLQKVLTGSASEDEKKLFHKIWQGRVQKILTNPELVIEVATSD
ncbi:MAG: FmdE family protein [Sulfurimonas sp.]